MTYPIACGGAYSHDPCVLWHMCKTFVEKWKTPCIFSFAGGHVNIIGSGYLPAFRADIGSSTRITVSTCDKQSSARRCAYSCVEFPSNPLLGSNEDCEQFVCTPGIP